MSVLLQRKLVQLGNVSGGLEKTFAVALANPDAYVIGIDLKGIPKSELPSDPRPLNWIQWKLDFLTGMGRLHDNSVESVSSDFALGHYDATGVEFWSGLAALANLYTREVILSVHRKLIPGGHLAMIVPDPVVPVFMDFFANGPFDSVPLAVTRLPSERLRETLCTIHAKIGNPMFELIATK